MLDVIYVKMRFGPEVFMIIIIVNVEKHQLMDLDADGVTVSGIPSLPHGKVIDRVDVIVRLRDAD